MPVADLLNHHPTAHCTQLARVGEDFCYYALRGIAKGEEVCATYGALSDAQLLHTYGFTLGPANPHCHAVLNKRDVVRHIVTLFRLQGRVEASFAVEARMVANEVLLGREEGPFFLERPESPVAAAAAVEAASVTAVTEEAAAQDQSLVPHELATLVLVLCDFATSGALFFERHYGPLQAARKEGRAFRLPLPLPGREPKDGSGETVREAWVVLEALLEQKLRAFSTGVAEDLAWRAAQARLPPAKREDSLAANCRAVALAEKSIVVEIIQRIREAEGGGGEEDEEEEEEEAAPLAKSRRLVN